MPGDCGWMAPFRSFSSWFRCNIHRSVCQLLYYCLGFKPVTMKHLLFSEIGHSPFCPAATVMLPCLSHWKVSFSFSLPSCRLSSKLFLYSVPSIFPWILTSTSLSAEEKRLHNRILSPPCFTAEMMKWLNTLAFLQTFYFG